MFRPSLQLYRIGTHIILVHPLQLAVDLLPQLLGVGVGEEAGHDGGGDDEVWAPVNPLHTVSSRTGPGPSPPGPVEDWDPPDGAGLVQSEGPVESVSLQPPRVQVSVELIALVTSRQSGPLSLVEIIEILCSDWGCLASTLMSLRHSSRHPKH